MQKAFGKPIGQASQYKKGETIMEVFIDQKNLDLAKKALHRASYKLACTCKIAVIQTGI
jgi:ribosomal protein L16/L10AE